MNAIKFAAGVMAIGALTATTACSNAQESTSGSEKTKLAAASSQAKDAIRKVDWKNATLDLPKILTCPAGTVRFRNGVDNSRPGAQDGPATGPAWELADTIVETTPSPIYADLNGDGKDEALLNIRCFHGAPAGSGLVGVQLNAAGKPAVMGLVATPDVQYNAEYAAEASVTGGVIRLVIKTEANPPAKFIETKYRWNGISFVKLKK